MTRVVMTAMLGLLAVGVWAGPARAAVDIHIGIPGVVIVPPSDHYDYPRYIYPYSEPRYYYDTHHRRSRHHGHRHHYRRHRHHHHSHGR
jgi:hypothetical protein